MNTKRPPARTALITGGAKRLGRAIVEDLAAHGFSVGIHYNGSREEADRLAGSIREQGGTAEFFSADLTDAEACDGLFSEASSALGQIDLLVNNASIFKPDSAAEPDLKLMETHFAIHVRAPAILGAAMARQSGLEDGLIVNLVDQRVWALTPRYFSYTLSKSALWTATRTMAQQFAPKIRVNAIGPGPSLPNDRQQQEDFDAQVSALPLARGPVLDEFGATVRYFYENRSITGQMIALDGGQHLAWKTPDIVDARE